MIRFRLEELLKERGKSFYRLAKQAGINQTSMSMIRHSRLKTPNLEYLSRICALLDVQPGDIICEDGSSSGRKKEPRRRAD